MYLKVLKVGLYVNSHTKEREETFLHLGSPGQICNIQGSCDICQGLVITPTPPGPRSLPRHPIPESANHKRASRTWWQNSLIYPYLAGNS
jgi:hypothetical protein